MVETIVKKLPLKNVLVDSWEYCVKNTKQTLLLAVVAYVVSALALFCWKSFFIWPVLVLMYVLWGMFFRYYLKRKPYFDIKSLFYSLVPSTKIVMLSVAVLSVLLFLPIVPLFLNISSEFDIAYANFLQGNFENQDALLGLADVFFVFLSPIIAYRPFLAWISSLSGRSGSLKLAWDKTRGNYKEFLIIAIITNLSVAIVRWAVVTLGANDYVTLLFVAPVIVYFNLLSAKAYEFFFLEID